MTHAITKYLCSMLFGLMLAPLMGTAYAAEPAIENLTIGAKGYHVGSYGDGAYWVTDGLYNSMFVVSDEGVIVIDAPGTYADKLPAAIREVTDQPVKFFVYSHHHQDHTSGSAIFGEDVVRVGHELTAQELRRKNDPNRPIPTVTFGESYALKLGNQQVNLVYPGLQHSPGNVFIHLPAQKVLMLVDVLYPGAVPFTDFAVAASVPGYFQAFDQASKFDFDYYQGGHVGRPGTRDDFKNAHQYVMDIQANAGMGLQLAAPPLSFAGQNKPIADPYFPINTYISTATEICTRATLEKWRGVLSGGGLFTEGHCNTAIINMMID